MGAFLFKKAEKCPQFIFAPLHTFAPSLTSKCNKMNESMETVLMTLVPQTIVEELVEDMKEIKASFQQPISQTNLDKEWISSNEVLKLLGISRKTWQKYRDERRIPFSQFGRKIYVRKADLDAFMESHKIKERQ